MHFLGAMELVCMFKQRLATMIHLFASINFNEMIEKGSRIASSHFNRTNATWGWKRFQYCSSVGNRLKPMDHRLWYIGYGTSGSSCKSKIHCIWQYNSRPCYKIWIWNRVKGGFILCTNHGLIPTWMFKNVQIWFLILWISWIEV